MKLFAIICVAAFFTTPEQAHAETFLRNVKSGPTARMYTYHSWNQDCSPESGVVKVVTKPQHGKLTPIKDYSPPYRNRFQTSDPCLGKIMQGFRVEYTSAPGYRGTDSFVIEVTFAKRPAVIDTFTISVE
jgi:hypothetical protein